MWGKLNNVFRKKEKLNEYLKNISHLKRITKYNYNFIIIVSSVTMGQESGATTLGW